MGYLRGRQRYTMIIIFWIVIAPLAVIVTNAPERMMRLANLAVIETMIISCLHHYLTKHYSKNHQNK